MILEKNGIRLRALEPEDAETLYLWENDPRLWRVSGTLAPFSRETLRRFVEDQRHDIFATRQSRLIIGQAIDGRPVGTVDLFDLDPPNGRCGVGIMIYGDADRGKGHASAALSLIAGYCFDTLGLHQIYANVEASNTVSAALFSKHGFTIAGTRKEWNRSPAGWEDEHIMQLIREEG